jgi:hypothetical protein
MRYTYSHLCLNSVWKYLFTYLLQDAGCSEKHWQLFSWLRNSLIFWDPKVCYGTQHSPLNSLMSQLNLIRASTYYFAKIYFNIIIPRWRPGFEPRSGHVVFCGEQSSSGTGFLRVHRFLLPIVIPSTAPHSSSSIIRGWYSRLNSGRSAN